MADIQEFQCPCCGGAIEFNSTVQRMKCPYCDTEFEIEDLLAYDSVLRSAQDDDLNWHAQPGSSWHEEEEASLQDYLCQSCGGEIIADEATAATSCPYCGSPVILTGRLSGVLRPDCVIPFKLDKQEAKARLLQHCQGKRLLPKFFLDEAHLEQIKGIYVPFWLFDADTHASIRYRATKLRRWSTRDYIYSETHYYSVLRKGRLGFDNVPVDGSEKMPDALMEALEPFDFSQAVDFQTAYLAGYLADKYDIDADSSQQRAAQRIKQSVEDVFYETVHGFDTVSMESSGVQLTNSRAKYALFPVWILTTSFNGKRYTFAMNGQTGKFVGELPVDRKAAGLWTAGLTALFGLLIYGAAWLVWLL